MKVEDFDYDLPKELIAQDPLADRSSSRLLVLNRGNGEISHRHFFEIKDYLKKGDVLVLNNTRVIPARLLGIKKNTGAHIELLLLKRLSDTDWECLVKPGRRLKVSDEVDFGDGVLSCELMEIKDDGNRIVRFYYDGIFEEILDRLGEMPLPPYITHKLSDRERYQTVYAKYDGSAAAPTAGLHFTKPLLSELKDMGVDIEEVTLHVGLGTFRPVKADRVEDHIMHSEHYEIDEKTADRINEAKNAGRRIISVGTTSVRTLESAADKNGRLVKLNGDTSIFIYPGYDFKLVDSLITNFHLPKSTLIMLVSALAGYDNIKRAYREAVEERYRFFSFGDAMFIM